MVDFTSYEVSDTSTLYILHVVYVFVIAILLVNFLIALLSTSAGRVQEHEDVILMVQRLSVVGALEQRLRRLFSCYYNRVNKWLYHEERGKLYLIKVKSNL